MFITRNRIKLPLVCIRLLPNYLAIDLMLKNFDYLDLISPLILNFLKMRLKKWPSKPTITLAEDSVTYESNKSVEKGIGGGWPHAKGKCVNFQLYMLNEYCALRFLGSTKRLISCKKDHTCSAPWFCIWFHACREGQRAKVRVCGILKHFG